MPIAVQAMTDQDFATWIAAAKTKFASNTPPAPAAPTTSGEPGTVAVAEARQ